MIMKINILTTSVSRNAGGVLDAVRDLYKSSQFLSDEIKIYGLTDQYTELDLPTWHPLSVYTYNSMRFFNYSISLRDELLASSCDILHLHGLWTYPQMLVNTYKKHRHGNLIISPHGMLDTYAVAQRSHLKTMIANLLFANKSFENSECLHALCNSELKSIRQYGIDKPIAIIPNGVILPNYERKSEVDSKLKSRKSLLYLSRVHKKKGLDNLIIAYASILKNFPKESSEWKLDIVGWSDDGFDIIIKELIEKYKLGDHVFCHGGAFGSTKVEFYKRADAFILPSYSEGLPMSVLEAWSYSLPVVMTPECNIGIGFERNAAIEVSPNVESIKQGLLTLFRMEDEKLENIGLNGLALVKEEFLWDISAKKMLQLYDWVLNGGEKPEFVYL